MATADLITRVRARGVQAADLITKVRARAAISLTVTTGIGRTIEPGELIALSASASSVPDTWQWTQTDGYPVTLGGTGQQRTFTAPMTQAGSMLIFQVTATKAGATATDTITFEVYPHTMWRPLAGDIAPMVLTV